MEGVIELFHGSGIIVENPRVLINGFYKDFGYGFYCTNMEGIITRDAFLVFYLLYD